MTTETENKAVKPGWKTTEFWLTIAANLLAALMASGAFAADSKPGMIAAAILAGLACMGYQAQRTKAKNGK